MAGLVPAIHVFASRSKNVDARDKPGHDVISSDAAALTETHICPSSVSPPETSTLPGAGSRLSFLTTPSSTSIE